MYAENPLSGGAINQLTTLLTGDTPQDEALGRLVIDLDAIMGGSDVDIILEDGDKLHIPKVQQTISVLGEVYVPNTHVFKSNPVTGLKKLLDQIKFHNFY